MEIPAEKWESVKVLFDAALELAPGARQAFIEANAADLEIREEVGRLLAEFHEAGTFLSTPVLEARPDEVPKPRQRFKEGDLLASRFRVVRFIASGGMGEVYEANDLELHERLAIKTIRREGLREPNAVARFKREVQLARKVTHPNVCRIFDIFRSTFPATDGDEEIVFVSMEFLSGETLAERLSRQHRMTMTEALPFIQQMASALAAAHDAGITHRDFKPGNVVLVHEAGQECWRAVVTDFGLALRSVTSDETVSFFTGHGLLGTPAYMSPEQIEGRAVAAASDIYALGLVIYEMLTGRRPFRGDTPMSAAMKRLSEVPTPPRTFAPELSAACESAILRCLERDPADRFANARDVATALAENIPQPTTFRKPRTAIRPNRWVSAMIIALLVAAGGYKWRTMHPSLEPLVAVAGFKNNSGDTAYDWLATDLSETLTADLGASKGIQTVSTDELARIRTELSIPPAQSLEGENLAEVRQAVGASYLLLGSYSIAGQSPEKSLTLDLRLESPAGATIGTFHRTGKELEYSKLFTEVTADLLVKLGTARLPAEEASEVQNLYPGDRKARQLYFGALDKLRSLDAPAALDLLQHAAERESSNVAIHSALADTWSRLKHDPEAAEEARKAAELAQQTSLPFEYVVLAQARSEQMTQNWDMAIKDYSLLFPHYPKLNYGLQLASVQLEGSRPQAALETLHQLATLRPPMNNDPRIEITRAKVYGAMNNFPAELGSAQLALTEAQKRNARMMQASAELEVCWAYRNLGHVEEALAACNQAQTIFSAFGDNVSAAVALNDEATWLSDRGRYAEAKQLFDKIIAIHRAAGAQKDLAGANVNAAVALVRMGKPELAGDYIDEALRVAVSIHDKANEALAHILKGQVLFAEGHDAPAEEEVRSALAIARQLGNIVIEATSLSNLAEYQSETDSGSSLAAYEQVLKLRRKIGDPAALATCLFNMGDLQYRRAELEAAEASYQEAIQISIAQKDKGGVAVGSMSLAQINLERNRLAEAEGQARDAIEKLREVQDPDLESMADSVLLRVLVAERKFPDAKPYADRIRTIASQDRDTSFENRISLAIFLAAVGATTDAVQQLQTMPSEAKQAGRNFAALEAELLLLELQAAGQASSGPRNRALLSIRKRAEQAGFKLLANRTARVRV